MTGYDFDDSLTTKLPLSHYVRGIIFLADWYPLNWFQCLYSSLDDPENLIEGDIHGMQHINDTYQRLFLDKDEQIDKIEVKIDYVQLYQNGIPSLRTRLIMGIRFFTTKGRKSQSIDNIPGERYIEQFDGYILGYVTGKSGRYIDQLQFYWYKTL
jgi:hypothetical protein